MFHDSLKYYESQISVPGIVLLGHTHGQWLTYLWLLFFLQQQS